MSTRNVITADQRNQYLPAIEALLKVMETNRPSTRDVNNLLVVTRNLLKELLNRVSVSEYVLLIENEANQ